MPGRDQPVVDEQRVVRTGFARVDVVPPRLDPELVVVAAAVTDDVAVDRRDPGSDDLIGERLERGRVERRIAQRDRARPRCAAPGRRPRRGTRGRRRRRLPVAVAPAPRCVNRVVGARARRARWRPRTASRCSPGSPTSPVPTRRRPCRRRRLGRTTRPGSSPASVAFCAACASAVAAAAAATGERRRDGAGTTAGRSPAPAWQAVVPSSWSSWSAAAPPRRRIASARRAPPPVPRPARSAPRSAPLLRAGPGPHCGPRSRGLATAGNDVKALTSSAQIGRYSLWSVMIPPLSSSVYSIAPPPSTGR